MSKAEDQLEKLDARLKASIVKAIGEHTYEVFVPGGFREVTVVKAVTEEEALEKVRANLIAKIKHSADKPSTGKSDGKLEVASVSQSHTADNVGGDDE